MSKQVKIKTEVELNFSRKDIEVCFWLEEKKGGDHWPKRDLLKMKRVSLKNGWGLYKDLKTLAREIVKVQNEFLRDFRALDGKYYNTVRKLCQAYNGGEIVLEDGQTSEFIGKFTGQIP